MNKEEYWENRNAGLRGQGPKPNKVTKVHTVKEWKVIKRAERLEGEQSGKRGKKVR